MRLRKLTVIAVIALAPAVDAQLSDDGARMIQKMDAQTQRFGDISRKIWESAELGYKEEKSSSLLKAELQKAGFTIEDHAAGIPTAFVATWGSGKPVIGLLGEFDALPGLSQDAVPELKPIAAGQPGHGCGHNLLGTASAFAAIAVKDYLSERHIPGTVVFYATPAEEGGAGKVYMALAGVFDRSEAILTWHPGSRNQASNGTSLATIGGKFRAYGKASHAAAAPQNGRSALDALMLMSMCVGMMREHVPQETRMHYIFNKGGVASNVAPAYAEASFTARHTSMPVLSEIWDRVEKCSQAAGLGTGTRTELEVSGSVCNRLPNGPLSNVLDKNLRALGGLKYTSEEQAFAEALQKANGVTEGLGSQERVLPVSKEAGSASSDVGDVSWLIPTAQLSTATFVPGISSHSWASAACAGMSIGRKGMALAAKTLALSVVDLITEPSQLTEVKASFEQARAGKEYKSRIPAGSKPPLDYRSDISAQ